MSCVNIISQDHLQITRSGKHRIIFNADAQLTGLQSLLCPRSDESELLW